MVEYNPSLLQLTAQKLYKKSDYAVIKWMFLGMVPGFFLMLLSNNGNGLGELFCMFVFIGALGGLMVGDSKKNLLRGQAQHYLCDLSIENNLRLMMSPTIRSTAYTKDHLRDPRGYPGQRNQAESNQNRPSTVKKCPACHRNTLWYKGQKMWWCRHCRRWFPSEHTEPVRKEEVTSPEAYYSSTIVEKNIPLGDGEALVEEEVLIEEREEKEIIEEITEEIEIEGTGQRQEGIEEEIIVEHHKKALDDPDQHRALSSVEDEKNVTDAQQSSYNKFLYSPPPPPPISRDTFPKVIECPYCRARNEINTIGNFICGQCAQVGRIDEYGIVERE